MISEDRITQLERRLKALNFSRFDRDYIEIAEALRKKRQYHRIHRYTYWIFWLSMITGGVLGYSTHQLNCF